MYSSNAYLKYDRLNLKAIVYTHHLSFDWIHISFGAVRPTVAETKYAIAAAALAGGWSSRILRHVVLTIRD